jgi:hypothetical protein
MAIIPEAYHLIMWTRMNAPNCLKNVKMSVVADIDGVIKARAEISVDIDRSNMMNLLAMKRRNNARAGKAEIDLMHELLTHGDAQHPRRSHMFRRVARKAVKAWRKRQTDAKG